MRSSGGDERGRRSRKRARPRRDFGAARVLRAAPGDARRRPGLDDRLHGAAHDRGRPRRPAAHLVGGHRLPARPDDRHAALRQDRRPLRAQARAAGGAGAVPDRLGPLRRGAEHDRADRLPRDPGARRRRPDGAVAGGDRRRGAAVRARALQRLLRRHLRRGDRDRPAARRLPHDQPLLALDLLREPAGGRHRDRRAGHHAALGRAHQAAGRLRRHRAARRLAHGARPGHEPRRQRLRLGLGLHPRDGDRRRGAAGRVHLRGAAQPGARAAPLPVPQQRDRHHRGGRADRRLRAARLGDLSAHLPAGGERRLPHGLRPAVIAAHGRAAGDVDHHRPDRHAHRALQTVPDHRHRRDGPRALPALHDGRAQLPRQPDPVHARAGDGARPGDAGAGAGRAERGELRATGRGHLQRHAVPADRERARHRGAGRRVLEPAGERAEQRAAEARAAGRRAGDRLAEPVVARPAAAGDPRRLRARLRAGARHGVPRGRRDQRGGVRDLLADQGGAAAPDRDHHRRERGAGDANRSRLAHRDHARARRAAGARRREAGDRAHRGRGRPRPERPGRVRDVRAGARPGGRPRGGRPRARHRPRDPGRGAGPAPGRAASCRPSRAR